MDLDIDGIAGFQRLSPPNYGHSEDGHRREPLAQEAASSGFSPSPEETNGSISRPSGGSVSESVAPDDGPVRTGAAVQIWRGVRSLLTIACGRLCTNEAPSPSNGPYSGSESSVIAEVFARALSGDSCHAIARRLNVGGTGR